MNPNAPEAELLQIIGRRLPLKDQQRVEILRDRLQAETLSEDEHYELLQWVDRIEIQDAERATALFRLAQLRDVDFQTILQEFPTNIGSDVIGKHTPIAELRQIATSKQLRPLGLCTGEFIVPDDFDDSLPEDLLKAFEGT